MIANRLPLSRSAQRIFLRTAAGLLAGTLGAASASAQTPTVDLLDVTTDPGRLTRVYGSVGTGVFGVPVAGPGDMDGDGLLDYAVAYMRANPLGRSRAGEVDLIFGNGSIGGTVDTAPFQPGVLRIAGDVVQETAGDEIWIADVTGDGVADLLIGRQNYTPSPTRIGAGALSIIIGGPELRQFAAQTQYLDLRAPQAPVRVFTLIGREAGDRMGIWMRTGDVDGDGVDDVLVGADGEDQPSERNNGAVYLIRGGGHLASSRIVDLSDNSVEFLSGNLARLHPPANSTRYHLGATCLLADLDGNGRSEVLAAAALNRAGAGIPPMGGSAEGSGGSTDGTVYIAWDDNFPAPPWPADFNLNLAQLPGSATILEGGSANGIFGEEVVAGGDFDGDGNSELFVGDFEADSSPGGDRLLSGTGYVFYNAAQLKGRSFSLDSIPPGVRVTRILGPSAGSIGADTAAQGDFNRDGLGDLLFGSPHDRPQGRISAGSIHVIYGRPGGWPERIDLATLPEPSGVRITHIQGAHGTVGADAGDTLCYSATAGDVDEDGFTDILTNEMLGNGLTPGAVDAGNFIAVSGRLLAGQAEPLAASALFAALARQDFSTSNPPRLVRTTFTVSNILAAPPGFSSPLLDLSGEPRSGSLEFHLFARDGSRLFVSTQGRASLGVGLNASGELEPGHTYSVTLAQLLEAAGGDALQPFTGYVWVLAHFPAAAGSYSIMETGDTPNIQNYELTPAVGNGLAPRAGLPLRLP